MRILLYLICLFAFCSAHSQSTPNGTLLTNVFIYSEFTPSQIASANNYVATNYPNATRLTDASAVYNCHAYAWHMTEGGSAVWINTPSDDQYWQDGSYRETSQSCHTKVSYASDDHSAVATTTTNVFVSKWGQLPTMQHTYNYCPYNSSNLKYYERNHTMSGAASFCTTPGTYSITPALSPSATINWTTSPSWVITPNNPTSISTTLTKNTDDAFSTLTATISYSCGTSTSISQPIAIGFPYFSQLGIGPAGPDTLAPNSSGSYSITVPPGYPSTSYYWRVPSGWSILAGQGTESVYVQSGALGSTGPVEVDVTACGLTRLTHKYVTVAYGGSWIPDFSATGQASGKANPDVTSDAASNSGDMLLKVSPNPASGFAQIALNKKGLTIREIRIADKTGNVRKQFRFNNGQQTQRISVEALAADLYTIIVYDGRLWHTAKLLVVK